MGRTETCGVSRPALGSRRRTGRAPRRPVVCARAASITGAVPLRSISSAAKATVSSLTAPLTGGSACASAPAARPLTRGRRRRPRRGGRAGTGTRLGDPGDGQQRRDRRARGQVIADEAGPGPAHRRPRRGRAGGQAAGETVDEVLVAAIGRPGATAADFTAATKKITEAATVARKAPPLRRRQTPKFAQGVSWRPRC